MATAEKARSDDWKDKYFKALNELDEHERARAEKIGRLSRDLLAVLERFGGANPSFDEDLERLKRSDKLADDAQQARLRSLVATLERMETANRPTASAAPSLPAAVPPAQNPVAPLRELLARLSVPTRLQPTIAELRQRAAEVEEVDAALLGTIAEQLSVILGEHGEDRTLAARDALQALIDHLSLPPAAQARLGMITPQLQQAQDVASVRAIAKTLADFVVDYIAGLHTEVAGLNTFLLVIKSRLGEVSGFVDLEKSERNVADAARDQLSSTVKSSLDTMRGRVDRADDIDQLKQDIQRHIGLIDGSLTAFMQTESARSSRVDEQHVALSRKIEEMHRETDRLRKELSEAQDQALRDALTGLPNRLAFNERMATELARSQRGAAPLSLIVLDLDRFKTINDSWGHQAGDRVLKYLARELASQIRQQDFFGRYGGEEFVLILPDTARAGALRLADGLRRHIEACRFKYKDAPVAVTISCGIAELRAGETSQQIFERADNCLYAAKNNGRNRCEVAA
ncbi:MAG: GGDEF domain-containing protein [Gammaproteobacteria bacterium]